MKLVGPLATWLVILNRVEPCRYEPIELPKVVFGCANLVGLLATRLVISNGAK